MQSRLPPLAAAVHHRSLHHHSLAQLHRHAARLSRLHADGLGLACYGRAAERPEAAGHPLCAAAVAAQLQAATLGLQLPPAPPSNAAGQNVHCPRILAC